MLKVMHRETFSVNEKKIKATLSYLFFWKISPKVQEKKPIIGVTKRGPFISVWKKRRREIFLPSNRLIING